MTSISTREPPVGHRGPPSIDAALATARAERALEIERLELERRPSDRDRRESALQDRLGRARTTGRGLTALGRGGWIRMTRRSPAPRCPSCRRSIDAHTREEMLACSAALDTRRCVLCGDERPRGELREHVSQDYRGQRIVVLICVDAAACVGRAVAARNRRDPSPRVEPVA